MKKYLLAVLLTAVSTQTLAWGDFERGIVSGVAGYWLYDKLTRPAQPAPIYPAGVQLAPPVRGAAPAQPHNAPPPSTWFYRYPECRTEYLYNNIGVAVATQSICN
jgi:hypothetical protein